MSMLKLVKLLSKLSGLNKMTIETIEIFFSLLLVLSLFCLRRQDYTGLAV